MALATLGHDRRARYSASRRNPPSFTVTRTRARSSILLGVRGFDCRHEQRKRGDGSGEHASSTPCRHAGKGLRPHVRRRTVTYTSRPEDTMRRRLYFIMPDVASARKMMDDLLLARVEERHIHFLAKRGTPMDGLHEANHLQKTDLVHGAQVGLALGALLGFVLGAVLVMTLVTDDRWQIVTV
jgi:hypothetical protein